MNQTPDNDLPPSAGLPADVLPNTESRKVERNSVESSNAELSHADLSNSDLSNSDLSNSELSNSELSNSELSNAEQLYTPALLAEILKVSVRVVRRWHRAGLLRASTQVMQLPYFDFSQLATARRLARWMEQGATVQSIQRQLQLLRERAGDSQVAELLTVENLPITAEGKRLVLRSGDHYLEASGQLRFGFQDSAASASEVDTPATVLFAKPDASRVAFGGATASSPALADSAGELTLQQMLDAALTAEDVDDLPAAIDWIRSAMAAYGASSDLCFQLAELLYREGDLSGARERYFMALELDPNLVEARANLGCVLAECGQPELAVAAFEGTLEQFADYADVHFHLARALEDTAQTSRAIEHWQRFLELAPASPWAEEAAQRLSHLAPLLDF